MRIRNSQKLIEVLTPAKVNLYLEILGRREDGFHELETVISTVSIFDSMEIENRDDGQFHLRVASSDKTIPTGASNLVIRSLELLRQEAGNSQLGADIRLVKRIPSAAGLGGGSSNAAGALLAGNQLWQLGLSWERLLELAGELGSDVPCFLRGGASFCFGRGERVRWLKSAAGLPMVIAKPVDGLETAAVYRAYAEQSLKDQCESRSIGGVLDAVSKGRPAEIGRQLFNRLRSTAATLSDSVSEMAYQFSRLPSCLGHQMSGSGSAYFGLFPTWRAARIGSKHLSARLTGARIFTCCTVGLASGSLGIPEA